MGRWWTEETKVRGLREGQEIEAKKAQGREGQGEIPKGAWETYAAFANTMGGYILLGVAEGQGKELEPLGVRQSAKMRGDLWAGLQDKAKVSLNLLSSEDLMIHEEEGKEVVVMYVPPADRKSRPVFCGGNPLGGTYKRLGEDDYRCTQEEVEQMIREKGDAQDHAVLEGFDERDLEPQEVESYLRRLSQQKPMFDANYPTREALLYELGLVGQDRATRARGLTKAGLLLLGRYRSIQDGFPRYQVEYRGYDEEFVEGEWSERWVTGIDRPWSLLRFFSEVWAKLSQALPVAMRINGEGRREDTTLAHFALREALANAILHADYTASSPVIVTKKRGAFVFENSGRLRRSVEEVKRGGWSDPRNPKLHQLFGQIGIVEQAGRGGPQILRGWLERHWKEPTWEVDLKEERTRLTLSMEGTSLQEGEVHKGDETAAKGDETAAKGDETAAKGDETAAKGDGGKEVETSKEGMRRDEDEVPERWKELARPFREGQRTKDKESSFASLLALCKEKEFSLRELGVICRRGSKKLKEKYVSVLVREGRLEEREEGESYLDWRYKTKEESGDGASVGFVPKAGEVLCDDVPDVQPERVMQRGGREAGGEER